MGISNKRIITVGSFAAFCLCLATLAGTVSGCGSLIRASASGDVEKIQTYLNEGEKVDAADKYGMTPLIWAIYYGQENAVEFLIKKGADVNHRTVRDFGDLAAGSTPMIFASYYGHVNIVRTLLKKGAKKDIANARNQTPLSLAKQYNVLAIELLLSGDKGGVTIDETMLLPNSTIVMNDGKTITGRVVEQDASIAQVKTTTGIVKLKKEDILFMRIDQN